VVSVKGGKMTKRSILEKKKMQKDRLKLQREIGQHAKK
jgi:hypothetical protein